MKYLIKSASDKLTSDTYIKEILKFAKIKYEDSDIVSKKWIEVNTINDLAWISIYARKLMPDFDCEVMVCVNGVNVELLIHDGWIE